jgi:hypothetical protein
MKSPNSLLLARVYPQSTRVRKLLLNANELPTVVGGFRDYAFFMLCFQPVHCRGKSAGIELDVETAGRSSPKWKTQGRVRKQSRFPGHSRMQPAWVTADIRGRKQSCHESWGGEGLL